MNACIGYAQYLAENPLPNHTECFASLVSKAPTPLSKVVVESDSRPYAKRRTKKEQQYDDIREQERDRMKEVLLSALASPPGEKQKNLSTSAIGKMVGESRIKVLKHLFALEKQGFVSRLGDGVRTKWRKKA